MNHHDHRPPRTRNVSQTIAEILSDTLEEKLSKAHGDDIRIADGTGQVGVAGDCHLERRGTRTNHHHRNLERHGGSEIVQGARGQGGDDVGTADGSGAVGMSREVDSHLQGDCQLDYYKHIDSTMAP